MKAAIYARKSTDDNDRDEDNKSVTRQVQHAKAYAESKGWSVDPEHIFVDDNQSGAVFNRPALVRMLSDLREFDVIVMSELSRLGREQSATGSALADIVSKDVKVFFYLTDEELRYETAVDKFLVQAVAFAAELEREKASQRSRDALLRKAERGYNTGGRVYGYDNVPIFGTNAEGHKAKQYTDYRINEGEAEIVRGIFCMYADGNGHTSIAKTLNGDPRFEQESRRYFDGQTPPSPWKGTGSWAPSTIREMLYRERYRGVVPFGEYRKVVRNGIKKRIKQDSYLMVNRKDLEIIPPDLWRRVATRLKTVRKIYLRDTGGVLCGKPDSGRASKYLLASLARCACCQGSIVVSGEPFGSGSSRRRVPHYICSYHHKRGETVCANHHKERIKRMDAAVLAEIERMILTPDNVDDVIEQAMRHLIDRRKQGPDKVRKLKAEHKRISRELNNLVTLVTSGSVPKTITREIKTREQRLEAIEQELGVFRPVELSEFDERRMRKACKEQMGRFKDLIYSNVPLARQALRKLLAGPIYFAPVVRLEDRRRTFHFEGNVDAGPLLDRTLTTLASPRGFEPLLQP